MDDRYIIPVTNLASSFEEAKEEYGKYGYSFVFEDNKINSINDLSQGKRNLIIGEPGIGKTELMKRLEKELEKDGHLTKLIPLRSLESTEEIDKFLSEDSSKPKAILLDAIDEISLSTFSGVIKKIEQISEQFPDLKIFVSGRWIFVEKYATSFAGYRFITVMPFTNNQMKEYLVKEGHTEADVDALFQRMMQFGHGRLIIQVPRYLFLFEEFLKGKNIRDVQKISRNELFEHFIYSKLELEAAKNRGMQEMVPVIKRLLEKLALTMEIYQTNAITKEELVTFFDDLKSDIKLVVLTQVSINILLQNSVLQQSREGIEKLEFENAEFQEYLAAKEITRLPEPRRAAFAFAADQNIKEIYPSWYNTLSFLVDMLPETLDQLVDFSGIRGSIFKIADEGFMAFLGRINPTPIPSQVKERLFEDVIEYHEAVLQWLPGHLAVALPGFFSPVLENYLKKKVTDAEAETGTARYVCLGNLAYVVGYLLHSGIRLDTAYWRPKLIQLASEPFENGVLPRHALFALENLHDPSVIDDLPDLTAVDDELVAREFVSMCTELAPDNPRSVEYFISTVKKNELTGRYGLFAMKNTSSIKRFLQAYSTDESFRREFLDDTSIFKEKDKILVDNIKAVADSEIRKLSMEAIIKSVHYSVGYTRGQSEFISGLMEFLHEGNPGFIPDLIRQIRASENGETSLYFAQEFLINIIKKEEVASYIDAMQESGENQKWVIMSTLTRIKFSTRDDANEVYEAGREKLPNEYKEYEESRARPTPTEDPHNDRIISGFRLSLNPGPNQYMTNVFHDYIAMADRIDPLMDDNDRARLDSLIVTEALRHDPALLGLTITEESDDRRVFTSSGASHMYGDALLSAKRRGVDITPYRTQIARFIPFAHNDELKAVFDLVPNFTAEEINPMIEIYRQRNTDLWRYLPENFIEAAERYNLVDTTPILQGFVKESGLKEYARVQALNLAENLQPNPAFLEEVFNLYSWSENVDDNSVAAAANGLLISKYGNQNAIKWRMEKIIGRVAEYNTPRSGMVHNVSPINEEINYGKAFAKPLMELKKPGFEDQYLDLLDHALEIWKRGEGYHAYAQYVWGIVYAYFGNLKEEHDYKPLRRLEEKLAGLGKKDGANWMAARMVELRRSYLGTIGKPPGIAEAIRKYNVAREYDDKKITNSTDLFSQLQDAIDVDLRRWIEGEGAYELILVGKVYKTKKQEYEKLIQKTLKAQIENILIKRGFQVDVVREPDLLNDKKVDFLVRYGFVGPIVLEVKLTSNSDIKASDIAGSKSYKSMEQYMKGYGSSHGIFLIIDNTGAKNLPQIKEEFGKIKGVSAISLDCYKLAPRKTKRKSRRRRRSR